MIRKMMSRSMPVLLVLFVCLTAGLAFALDIERMSKEDLLAQLGQDDVVVVDVRTGRDWKSSEFKIKGAVRYEGDIVNWASAYGKDTTLVLYCA